MTIHQKSKSHLLTELILAKGQYLETEQMFRDNNETWPVMIPEEEINQSFPRIIIVRHLVVTWGLSISSVDAQNESRMVSDFVDDFFKHSLLGTIEWLCNAASTVEEDELLLQHNNSGSVFE
ncbi:hypothetical protein IFM89_002885 [Coptis chinensis]|uniref:Uncharacterized protein n=1 Tax=Coptis chinensis TaxID=261450 RepID=A0A835IH65_9MAGN|nr:hypothetical protein IFM89_002885 [Coptis chinensis]